MANYSGAMSPQFEMLSDSAKERILRDIAETGNSMPTLNFTPDTSLNKAITGTVFKGDEEASGMAVGPLSKGLPSVEPEIPENSLSSPPTSPLEAPGALTRVMPKHQPLDLQAMLAQFVPQDDSSSKYLAMAAALGRPTGFGTLGETISNVSSALMEQKANQEKLRTHYVPLIMQQVAAQQARDEQAAYRLEAQQIQIEAQKQAQRERLAAQQLAAQQHAELIKTLAGQKPPPTPLRQTDNKGQVWVIDHYGKPTLLLDPQGNPIIDKDYAGQQSASLGVAPILGVPTPKVLPWASQSNPKDADKVKAAEQARGAKDVESDNDTARGEAVTAQQMKQFMELNARVATGELGDKVPGGQWVQSFGKDYATMQAISSELIAKMRVPGSGSSSDLDVKMFARATIGVDKPKETNDNIAQAIIQRAQNAKDYADFRSTYLEQNGTLQGANTYWNKYLQDNPIFDPKKAADFTLNPNRKTWRDYFAQTPSTPATPTPEAEPKIDIQAEAERLLKKYGGR